MLGIPTFAAGESSTEPPFHNVVARYDIISGDQQYGAPGQMLSTPLVVRVVNPLGEPVPGEFINFVVTTGGGSVYGGSTMTNEDGVAHEWWILGSAGPNAIEVRAVDGNTGEKKVYATFTAEAVASAPVDTIPMTPPPPVVRTEPLTRDTFNVAATWGVTPGATSYEWTASSDNKMWSASGSATATSQNFKTPILSKSSYSFCIRSVDEAQRRSPSTCVAYKATKPRGR